MRTRRTWSPRWAWVAVLAAVAAVSGSAAVAAPASMASSAGVGAPASAAPPPAAGTYVALAPARILDTRVPLGVPAKAKVSPHASLALTVLGKGGVATDHVAAVVLNLTVTNAAAAGYVTAFAHGSDRPGVSNLNFVAGQTVADLAVVKVGTLGTVDLYNGSAGGVDLVADIAGYYVDGTPTDPGTFAPLTPRRILDTRTPTGVPTRRPVAGHGTVALNVAGVPSGAAVVLTVTATDAAGSGYVTAYPHGASRPTASNLNFVRGRTVPNLVVTRLGTDNKVDLYNGSASGVDLVADLVGYYVAGSPSDIGALAPVDPSRILDTRAPVGVPASSQVGAHHTLALKVTGAGDLPPNGVAAVVLNLTATNAAAAGYVTAYPHGTHRPTVSNLNVGAGQTVANLAVVQVGSSGTIDLYNGSSAGVDLVADVAGYVLAPPVVAAVDLGDSMSPRPDPSVSDFVVGCPSGSVTAAISAANGGSVSFDGAPAVTTSGTATVPLSPGQSVRWTLSRPGEPDVEQEARCLPADFPTWQSTRTGTPSSQWYVLTPNFGTGSPAIGNPLYVVVADAHGTPVWWDSVTTSRPIDAKLLPGADGLMYAEAGIFFSLSTTYHEVGWDGSAIGSVGSGANIDMHDLVPSGDGGWYAIRYVPRDCVGTGNDCADMTAYGGSTEGTIVDGQIVELDASGQVEWTWSTRTHIPFSEWSDLTPASHVGQARYDVGGHDYWDIVHLNSVEVDGDALIVSSRNLDAVYRISRSDGSVLWKLGGTTTSGSLTVAGDGAGRTPFLNSQHDARRLPNGDITVFDNGTEGLRTPRALELTVDPVAHTATVVRAVTDDREPLSPCCGSVRPVPSGGLAIAWGGTGLFTETDASGAPVLSLDLGSTLFSYRVVPVAPGVVSRATLQDGMDAMHPRAAG